MVANDNCTTTTLEDESYLDVDSLTTDQSPSPSTADLIPKAILWNHGFQASERVIRAYVKTNEFSPTSQGALDKVKYNTHRTFGGGMCHLKHGGIVALRHKHYYLNFGTDQKVSFSRELDIFLVMQQEDKFAFYNIKYNTNLRELHNRLDGTGGEVQDNDPLRFCDLFTDEPSPKNLQEKVNLRMPSGIHLHMTTNNRHSSYDDVGVSDLTVELLSDAFSYSA